MADDLPMDEWDYYIGPNGRPRIDVSPSAPTDDTPFERAAARTVRGVKGGRLPVQGPEAPPQTPNYLIEPDLLETQQGGQSLPTDVAYNDAGIPFNTKTGIELATIPRLNVLPVTKTPDGLTFAMPKMLDLFGNVMGGIGAPAVATKAGEVVLGSGAVRTAQEAATQGPFYSALERAVGDAKLTKGDAQQWLGYLKNQPGVKSEEINTVLKDLPAGPITKEQLQGVVKGNKVELKEVVKGAEIDPDTIYKQAKDYVEEKYPRYNTDHPKYQELIDDKMAELEKKSAQSTKYHQYQLPGAEPGSYKETLLTLNNKEHTAQSIAKENGFPWDELTGKDVGQLQEIAAARNRSSKFSSGHWDEPNILAHIRHNDRMVDGKKTLHLEEIQSDWHQAGRKQGYKLSDAQRKDLDSIENKLTTNLTEGEIGNPDIDNVLKVAVDKKVISSEDAKNYKDYVKGENSTVPDAPFKKNWDELALKKMLHKAANEGYEGISWTPGEAQAARYDLSKTINKVQYVADKNHLMAYDHNGKQIVNKTGVMPEQLADNIGKEAAEKLMKAEATEKTKYGNVHSLEGQDLKVGGEGMKSFYDKMLIDRANNLAKKYGSKVEQRDLKNDYTIKQIDKAGNWSVTDNSTSLTLPGYFKSKAEAEAFANSQPKQPIHYLPITPELRAKAKEGFPLFSQVPITVPVQGNPFTDDTKKRNYSLVPVPFDPFNR